MNESHGLFSIKFYSSDIKIGRKINKSTENILIYLKSLINTSFPKIGYISLKKEV